MPTLKVPPRMALLHSINVDFPGPLRYSFTSNLPVAFSLTGPQGNTINQGRNILNLHGHAEVHTPGHHTLTFDNRRSILTPKHIRLNVEKPPRPPLTTPEQDLLLHDATENYLRHIGKQARTFAQKFDHTLAPPQSPIPEYHVPDDLQEAARNMTDYFDWDLTPAHIIFGQIPTPNEWDTPHALHLITAFHIELNQAKEQIPHDLYVQTLNDTLEFTLLISSIAARDYNKDHLDRMARGDSPT